ncbi:hypothetical protein AYI68_g3636 [Smittium mucronatum]|uniref:Uncharacterized protein n=1 Tax=Smittium mucronatum TaxID=133383 RepID=A0A1R0GZF4_9FUNG|nr:hypothetical protein AYI68_g6465 [Smittium mucronatum]OLY82246.1 hypothetical protein AYI68_g3636 [Smittium mucronatum]
MTGSIELVLPLEFSQKFGLSSDKIGYTFIAFSVPSVIGSLLTGKLMNSEFLKRRVNEHKKRYIIILVGNVIAGIIVILTGIQKSLVAFIVFMAMNGLATGCGNVPVMAALGAHIDLMSKREGLELENQNVSKSDLSKYSPNFEIEPQMPISQVDMNKNYELPAILSMENSEIQREEPDIKSDKIKSPKKDISTSSGGNGQVYSLYNVAYSLAAIIVPIVSSSIYKTSGLLSVCLFLGFLLILGTSGSMIYIIFRGFKP